MEFNEKTNQILFKDNFEFQMMKAIIKYSGGNIQKIMGRRKVSKKVK